MAKQKINTLPVFDFPLWGLVTAASPHKVCHHLNKNLQIELAWDKEILMEHDNHYVNLYSYHSDIDFFTIELIQNKNTNAVFIPELKNIDYFLLIRGELEMIDINSFIRHVQSIDTIQTVISLPIQKIKSKHNFLIYQ